jgi:hypothetical protein
MENINVYLEKAKTIGRNVMAKTFEMKMPSIKELIAGCIVAFVFLNWLLSLICLVHWREINDGLL